MLTPDQIQQLQNVIGQALRDPSNFPWLFSVVTLTLLGLVSFFGAYLGEKAKNRALKEDIETLTHKIQGVTALYTQHVEMFKANAQLRNAALTERLKAHQGAYSLWFRMFARVWRSDENATMELYHDCRKWWADNCLYLTPEARDKFLGAINCISMHKEIRGSSDEVLERNWRKIEELGDILVRGVELPELGEARLLAMPARTSPQQAN